MFQFKSLTEVAQYFKSEEISRTFLEKMRWPDGVIVCPLCGVPGAYRMGDCKTYKCKDKDCKSRFSVTVGTVLENTKLPLAKWFMAMYLVSAHKKGISSHQLARDLDIRQKAAWFLLMRCREMFKNKSILSNTVEADTTYVGGKWSNMPKKKRAKMVEAGKDNKTAVMGMVERGGDANLVVVGNKTFKEVLRENVEPSAFINTDEHNGFVGLTEHFADHASINHSQGEFLRDGVTTNTAEGAFSLFKRMIIGIYHQVSPKHLQFYCDEMTYRYNSRKIKDGARFIATFNHIQGRLTWKRLTQK